MKKTRKLLSLLLAAALAGQMGVVAWGTETGSTPACKVADHGKANHNVADASSCTTGTTHWLTAQTIDGASQMIGGTGKNYYYVAAGDLITCNNGALDYIIVNPDVLKQNNTFSILSFETGKDKIYFMGSECSVSSGGTQNTYTLFRASEPYATITSVATINGTTDVGQLPIPTTLVIEETSGKKNAKRDEEIIFHVKTPSSGGLNDITYTWQKKDGTKWGNVASVSGTPLTVKVPSNATINSELIYRCVATDEAGSSVNSNNITITVSGCDKTGALSDITNIETNYQVEQGAIQNITLPNIFSITGGNCDVHGNAPDYVDDPTHGGYAIKWDVQPAGQGASIENNNTLKLDGAALPEGGQDFSLIATVYKGTEKTNVEKSFTFHGEKVIPEVCNATVTLSSITAPGALVTGEDNKIDCKSNFVVKAPNCNVAEHQGDNDHGYRLVWTFTPDGGNPIPGVNFTDGVFTIEKGKLPSTAMGGTLTATATKGAARTADAGEVQATTRIDFQAAVTCPAEPESITLKLNNLPENKWNITELKEQTLTPFNAEVIWKNAASCSDEGHKTSNNHGTMKWTIAGDPVPTWVEINKSNGQITIKDVSKIPSLENTITIQAAIEKDNGNKTAVEQLIITRPKICDKKIKSIEKITGQPHIYVEQGDERIEVYRVEKGNLKYVDDNARCEFTADDNHVCGETIKWSILGEIENNSRMKDGAITLTPDGKLTVKGSKLQERNTYKVTIQAAVDGNSAVTPKTCLVEIHCTTPDDDDDDDSDRWEAYEDKIEDAKRGSTVKMDLTGNAEVPFYVFESARGRDVTLQMKAGKNYTWTINGKTMKKWPAGQIYLPLEVETLKDKTLTRLCRDYDVRTFKLRHEGSFYGDMKLTVDVGVGNAKKTMFLYSYDEDKERLTYQSSALADNNGDVTFVMTRSLGAYAVTSKALYGEKPVSSGGGLVGGSGSGPTTIYPPVAPAAPSSSQSSSSSSSSSSESSSESEPALPPEPPSSSQEPAAPVDTETKPKDSIPILVPVLILGIAGVITATVLVVRGSRGKLDDFDD